MSLDELLARVYAAPRGPGVTAVFDLDDTVVTGSVSSLDAYRGTTAAELPKLGRTEFDSEVAGRLHTEVWELVEAHHHMGHVVVLACAAASFQAEPIAGAIRAGHLLCREPEIIDGAVTGRWLAGPAREVEVRELADQIDLDLARAFAYGGSDAALPVLEAAGNPVAVNPGPGVARAAAGRGWPVLRCRARGGPPTKVEQVRTVGFYAGFATGVALGAASGLVRRSKRAMLDTSFARGADLGLAAAGVRVRVIEGAQHLSSARPGIFVFNHQSNIDPIIVMKLVRGKLTGVAKKEARDIPAFGLLFRFADVAFIDRGNTEQAKRALAPAVAKVREEGLSLLLAPEGTRSSTPRLGTFKKGAFHIAMQAGAPMVPIVIRNAGEVWWKGSRAISRGIVEVVVLPPIDSSTWQLETLGDRVEQVRAMFVDTLARWPGRPKPAPAPEVG